MSTFRHRSRRSRRGGFRPPHCPNRQCRFYTPTPGWNAVRDGLYTRPSDRRRFQRFRCRHCRRRFSTRTFAADYWLRRRDLLLPIARLSTESPGLRQTARLLGVGHATVGRHLARAGRHCLLTHREMVGEHLPREPLVIDGFETFEYSQFFPFHLNLVVGAESWFLHHFTDSPLRRKGAMTPAQKRRREELERRLGRPDPKAVERGIVELLRPFLTTGRRRRRPTPSAPPAGGFAPDPPAIVVHSDHHPAYRRAFRRLRQEPGAPQIRHRITPSSERRTASNPLFPVNLADLLLRHGQANHRRETIAFSKRRQAAVERLAIFTLWRNAIKWRREKKPGETAAMAAGILSRPWRWTEVFRSRRFPRRRLLPGTWWKYYWRRVKTLALGPGQTTHRLKYAF